VPTESARKRLSEYGAPKYSDPGKKLIRTSTMREWPGPSSSVTNRCRR
jgi:hypothetical protein